ncbi:MAG: hypothetical protein OSJ45_08960 [Lachnospiraceae bacterium]|nr:hypothetical protein [Lachnospiraceae bacterium]
MKTDVIPKIITLFAGAVVSVVCIIRDIETVYALKVLLATLVIFYIIGCIAKRIIGQVKDINTVMKHEETEPGPEQEDIDIGENISSGGFGNNP